MLAFYKDFSTGQFKKIAKEISCCYPRRFMQASEILVTKPNPVKYRPSIFHQIVEA